MSILIRGASLPKSCNECKLDLRTDICQAFCEWNAEHPYSIRATDRLPDCPLSEAPEPCEDTISRQVAIDALKICDNNEDDINCHKCPLRDKRWDGAWEDDETNCYTKLMRDSAKLLELPSAQPERKNGRWIPVDSYSAFGGDEATWMAHGNPVAFYYCSECKEQAYAGEDGESLLTDYCPNCGADMRGEQDDR